MVKVIGHLLKDVVEPGYCIGCASCVATCPVKALIRQNEIPVLEGVCINCGVCYGMCPESINPKSLQVPVFGKEPADEILGTYLQAFSAEAADDKVKSRGQDGGAVTALLGALLEEGYIDAAVVTGTGNAPWLPVARVATNIDELIDFTGTKFSGAPTSLGLREAVDHYYRKNVALVGTPCQIISTWRMKFSVPTNAHIADVIKLRVGLFCGGVFKYEDFFKGVIEQQLHIPLAEITKFDIRDGQFNIYLKSGQKRELAYSAVKDYITLPCKICSDYSAELADISVGWAGSPPERSTMIIRTQSGAEAFNIAIKSGKIKALDLKDVKPGIELLRMESKQKKEAAASALEDLRKQGKVLPIWLHEQHETVPSGEIEPLKKICTI